MKPKIMKPKKAKRDRASFDLDELWAAIYLIRELGEWLEAVHEPQQDPEEDDDPFGLFDLWHQADIFTPVRAAVILYVCYEEHHETAEDLRLGKFVSEPNNRSLRKRIKQERKQQLKDRKRREREQAAIGK